MFFAAGCVGAGGIGGRDRWVEAFGGGDGGQRHTSQAEVCSGGGDVEWVSVGSVEQVVELCLCPVDLGERCVVLGVGVGPLVDDLLYGAPVGLVGFGGSAQFTDLRHSSG